MNTTDNQSPEIVRWELDNLTAHHLQLLALQDPKVTVLFFPDSDDFNREPDFHIVRVRSEVDAKHNSSTDVADGGNEAIEDFSPEDFFLVSVRIKNLAKEVSVSLDAEFVRYFLAGNALLVDQDHKISWDLHKFASDATLPEDTQLSIISRRFPQYEIRSPASAFPSWQFYRRFSAFFNQNH